MKTLYVGAVFAMAFLAACLPEGEKGTPGTPGLTGHDGAPGEPGPPGERGADGKDTTVSGSRLRAVYRTTDDGAREAVGWFDKDTGERCSFSTAIDGMKRCVPPPVSNKWIYFVDDVCTKLVYPMGSKEAPLLKVFRVNNISGDKWYVKTGTQIATPVSVYTTDNDMVSCTKMAASAFPEVTFISVTNMPSSAFAESSESVE